LQSRKWREHTRRKSRESFRTFPHGRNPISKNSARTDKPGKIRKFQERIENLFLVDEGIHEARILDQLVGNGGVDQFEGDQHEILIGLEFDLHCLRR
jgi:hypothetical protein